MDMAGPRLCVAFFKTSFHWSTTVHLKVLAMVNAAIAIPILAAIAISRPAILVAADTVTTPQSTPVRDGSHDFDFIYGKWRMPNHRLKKRLANSHEWADFVTCDEGSPLPGGIGNIDYWRANYWKDFVGVTVRTYDAKTGLWRIYWVDNKFPRESLSLRLSASLTATPGYSTEPTPSRGKQFLSVSSGR
jgi:hypothetical protein